MNLADELVPPPCTSVGQECPIRKAARPPPSTPCSHRRIDLFQSSCKSNLVAVSFCLAPITGIERNRRPRVGWTCGKATGRYPENLTLLYMSHCPARIARV